MALPLQKRSSQLKQLVRTAALNRSGPVRPRVVQADPKNEEYAAFLFMGYVRKKDYKKQQMTAMTMFKNFQQHTPNSPYYFWAVMSIVMQAHVAKATGMAAMAERMFLPLAQKVGCAHIAGQPTPAAPAAACCRHPPRVVRLRMIKPGLCF